MSILENSILRTPISIIDFETTGLTPGVDRVIEISVVNIEPNKAPELFFDTLINPSRPVAATFIHGITDHDVKDALRFEEIYSSLLGVLEGKVICAYNASFDIRFLEFELGNVGVNHTPPHMCLMYLQPLLGIGKRCRLEEACLRYGVEYEPTHVAADDALASGKLMSKFLDVINQKGIDTFYELSRIKSYKFMESFSNQPFPVSSSPSGNQSGRFKSRSGKVIVPADPTARAMFEYWEFLKIVIEDLEISPEEFKYMERLRENLSAGQVRSIHAKAFATALLKFNNDQMIDDREARTLRKLSQCLAELGWSPGT